MTNKSNPPAARDLPKNKTADGGRYEKKLPHHTISTSNTDSGCPHKEDLLIRLMRLPEEDPRWMHLQTVLEQGTLHEDESLLNFTELSEKLSYDQSWLRRLKVHKQCGMTFAGSRRYRLSEVIEYLQSAQCRQLAKTCHSVGGVR